MNNMYIILLIAFCIILVIVLSRKENYAYIPYTAYTKNDGYTSSDDSTVANTCVPSNGVWATPNPGGLRSTELNSPCCQPPDYRILDSSYKTCDSYAGETDPGIQKCLADCCKNVESEKNNYDSSWYKMAKCGCALWCYNSHVPHFAKHGTAIHYIEGDIAEVNAPDTPSAASDWRGWIDFGQGGTN